MKRFFAIPFLTLLSQGVQAQQNTDDFFFSAGTGWPYFLNLKAEILQDDDRYYLNLGQGSDVGVALGWERIVDVERHHSLGMLAGALGTRDNEDFECDTGSFGDCLADIFDNESVYGLGVTYTYSPGGFDNRGWQFNFVAGYGEARESNQGGGTGSVYVSYRF